jgi:steroid 5-alpha reductase family enzyme
MREPLAIALAAALGMMTLVWVASLVRRNASIVDVFWGLGFLVTGWIYALAAGPRTPRGWLVVSLASLWALRLSVYILWRNWGRGEDYRYREMRERHRRNFASWSLVFVFWLQALLLWAISTPLHQAQHRDPAALGVLDALGLVLFAVGFAFEAGGDWQLARFKADPANRGRVMDRGLWRYTRHPNYFGDATVWWGLFCFAAATAGGWWTVYSPVLMTVLLLRVSGVSLLEKKLQETRPAYRDYARRTNAFFPWPPRASKQPGPAA